MWRPFPSVWATSWCRCPPSRRVIAQGRHDGDGDLAGRALGRPGAARRAHRRIEPAGSMKQSFDRDRHDGRFVDLRDHPLQRDWWWGSPEFEDAFGTLSINDILGRICADFGIARRLHATDPADGVSPTRAPAPPCCWSTESDGPSKQWSVDRWKSLADAAPRTGARRATASLATRPRPRCARSGSRQRARRRPATRSTCSARRPR